MSEPGQHKMGWWGRLDQNTRVLLICMGVIIALMAASIYVQYERDERQNTRAEQNRQFVLDCLSEQIVDFSTALQARASLNQRLSNAESEILLTAADSAVTGVPDQQGLIRALRNYRKEFREVRRALEDNPVPIYPDGICENENIRSEQTPAPKEGKESTDPPDSDTADPSASTDPGGGSPTIGGKQTDSTGRSDGGGNNGGGSGGDGDRPDPPNRPDPPDEPGELPDIEVPDIELPDIELPDIDLGLNVPRLLSIEIDSREGIEVELLPKECHDRDVLPPERADGAGGDDPADRPHAGGVDDEPVVGSSAPLPRPAVRVHRGHLLLQQAGRGEPVVRGGEHRRAYHRPAGAVRRAGQHPRTSPLRGVASRVLVTNTREQPHAEGGNHRGRD